MCVCVCAIFEGKLALYYSMGFFSTFETGIVPVVVFEPQQQTNCCPLVFHAHNNKKKIRAVFL